MSEITAKLVSELRAQTGAGLMDCKRALEEASGNFERAKEILRIRGQTIAEKKAGRIALEGLCHAVVSDDLSSGVLIDLNCETDFVAHTDDFRNLASTIASTLMKSNYVSATQSFSDTSELLELSINENTTIGNLITDAVGRIGENIRLSRVAFLKVSPDDSIVSSYVHLDGKIGVLVGIKVDDGSLRTNSEVMNLAKNLCLQIAAEDPVAVSRQEVSQDVLDRERRIIREQTLAEGKAESLVDKIVEGRMNKFFKESVLMEQEFVKDEKQTVEQVVNSVASLIGTKIYVVNFFRFQVGEG